MDRITILSYDKKLRFTITHGSTTDLQFTLPTPAIFEFINEDNRFEYVAESGENTKKTVHVSESVNIVYEPKQLSTTQLGYLESMNNYSRLYGYVTKMKVDTVNTYEPTVVISDIKYEYEANQHNLVRVTMKLKMKDIIKLSSYSVI